MLVTDIDTPTGGLHRQSWRLLEGLASRGHAAMVCARNYRGLSPRETMGSIPVRRTSVGAGPSPYRTALAYLGQGLSWLIANRAEFDLLHCQQMFGSAMLGLTARKLLRKPVIVRVSSTGELGEAGWVRKMPLSGLRLRQLRGVDRWVALTSTMGAEIRSLGVRDQDIRVIPNGTEIPSRAACREADRQAARSALGLGEEPVAVYTGRFSSEKGLDTLLAAWRAVLARHPDALLLLLGTGGAFRNVEAELRGIAAGPEYGNSVRFLGHTEHVTPYLLAADAFVLPSRTEGMSNALVEAMAAGCPIVASDIEANREILSPNDTALLSPAGDPASLAAAILALFGDRVLGRRLGEQARLKAQRDLSLESMVERYLETYRSVLSS